jgi:hypothetical protein
MHILRRHFAEFGPITAETTWKFIYYELLWIDGSTGLAHLYESDKAQPGRPWYDRTVIFTDMLCERFGGITRDELKQQIDRLFRACLEKLLENQRTTLKEDDLAKTITTLQAPVESIEHLSKAIDTSPEDSEDEIYIPDTSLVVEFSKLLTERVGIPRPQAEVFARELVAKARFYFTVERKRQNVLGEGFEDLLQLLLTNVSRVPEEHIFIRQRANKLPGFQNLQTTRERIEAPDIAIVRNNRTELIASVKWSLRHDRQKQLSDELDCYVDLLSQNRFPQYVLITNEYDPGRLVNTDGLNRRGQKIDQVYHINLELLLGTLHDHERSRDLRPLIASGRLGSIADFLLNLSHEYEAIS